MSDPTMVVSALAVASRRAAIVSLLGFIVVLSAIGYAFVQLRNLEGQRDELSAQILRQQKELLQLKTEYSQSRQSLAAARAAINAFHEGQLSDAVTLYDEALAGDPNNAYLQNLRAYALFKLGNVRAALEGQRQSLKADPNYAWGYFDLARFLCAISPPQLDEAKNAATKAVQLRPSMRSIMERDSEFQRVCKGSIPSPQSTASRIRN